MFEPYGDIKSFTMITSDKGQYGFVVYEDKTGVDKQHGFNAVNKAIEALSDKDLGNNIKLYVKKY